MADYLVIVESPAKAKTIERYLGKKYKVKASVDTYGIFHVVRWALARKIISSLNILRYVVKDLCYRN